MTEERGKCEILSKLKEIMSKFAGAHQNRRTKYGASYEFIANTRTVYITVERLTNILRHPNLVWNL